ncbi:MAG: hypothetical protein M3Y74_08280 [Chloroflexota bacterium]|nr:hypothetical protein [Chloroflexota bacterium]
MNEHGSNNIGDGEQPHNRGDLGEAIQALLGRLGEVLQGPEAQQVKSELEATARDVGRQIDDALEGPQAQALKERVADLLRAIQQRLR